MFLTNTTLSPALPRDLMTPNAKALVSALAFGKAGEDQEHRLLGLWAWTVTSEEFDNTEGRRRRTPYVALPYRDGDVPPVYLRSPLWRVMLLEDLPATCLLADARDAELFTDDRFLVALAWDVEFCGMKPASRHYRKRHPGVCTYFSELFGHKDADHVALRVVCDRQADIVS